MSEKKTELKTCELRDFDNQLQLEAEIPKFTRVVARGKSWCQGYIGKKHVLMSLGPGENE